MDIKTILVMTAIFVVISVIYFATQKKVIHQPSVATPQKPDPPQPSVAETTTPQKIDPPQQLTPVMGVVGPSYTSFMGVVGLK